MQAFADELTKIGQVSQTMKLLKGSVMPAVRKHGGKAALVAGGGLGALGVNRLADDIAFAEKARSQGYDL
jgi:hypothetical protein